MRTFLGGIFLGPFSSSLQEFFAVYSIFTELIVDVFCIERFLGKKVAYRATSASSGSSAFGSENID